MRQRDDVMRRALRGCRAGAASPSRQRCAASSPIFDVKDALSAPLRRSAQMLMRLRDVY
jgi:hypothetical protein